MKKLQQLYDITLCTVLGAGFWPFGPGTMGAAVGVLLWWLTSLLLPAEWLIATTAAAIILITLLSVPSINRLETVWGPDPSRVVIDEVVGVWICLLGVPFECGTPLSLSTTWGWVVAAFVLFRFFDILKPLGVRRMEAFAGGWGVMADDILAGLYGLVLMLIAQRSLTVGIF